MAALPIFPRRHLPDNPDTPDTPETPDNPDSKVVGPIVVLTETG